MKHFQQLSDDEEKVEEVVEDIVERYVSVHGDVRSMDEVIDELLRRDEDKKHRRWWAKG